MKRTSTSSVPTTSKRCASEHDEQCALIDWARRVGSRKWPELNWLFAIPNGGARHPAVAMKLKAEGVVSGVPDLALLVPRRGNHGLLIELKGLGGRVTEEQQGWIDNLVAEGYCACVCRGWDEARLLIEWYLTK